MGMTRFQNWTGGAGIDLWKSGPPECVLRDDLMTIVACDHVVTVSDVL